MAVTKPARHPSGAGPAELFSPTARRMPVVRVARSPLHKLLNLT